MKKFQFLLFRPEYLHKVQMISIYIFFRVAWHFAIILITCFYYRKQYIVILFFKRGYQVGIGNIDLFSYNMSK